MSDRISNRRSVGRPDGPAVIDVSLARPERSRRMLNRQRAILALLLEAGGEANHLPVTKWAFILRHEGVTGGGSSFYQFLPYRFGPFSFCLFQEMAALARDGFLTDRDHKWSLTPHGAKAAKGVPSSVRDDIRRIVRRHGRRSDRALIDYVYERYPWYTVNSSIRQLKKRTPAPVAVYTAGYEGLLVDGFLDGLMRTGIVRLVDVRNNPVSRRYGFHKSTLRRLCQDVGIDYIHYPQLGIRSSERQNLNRRGARESLFAAYSRHTLTRESAAVDSVARTIENAPSVLVCMEASPADCHRSRLAEEIASRTRLPVKHLEFQA